MSDEVKTIRIPKRRIILWIIRFVLVLLLLLLLAFLSSCPALLEIPILFLIGWIFHTFYNLPHLLGNWQALILPLTCLAIVSFLTHRFIHWWLSEKGSALTWKLVHTISAIALILLSAGAAIAMSGIVHQSAWLSNGPVLQSTFDGTRAKATMDAKQVMVALYDYQQDHGHYPDSLDALRDESDIPKKIFWVEADASRIREPFILLKPGGKMSSDGHEALIVSPFLTSSHSIIVGFEDSSVQICTISQFEKIFQANFKTTTPAHD